MPAATPGGTTAPRRGPVTGNPAHRHERRPPYRWISPARAAGVLGLTVRELYALVDAGELPAYRIADEVKLLVHDVEQWQRRHGGPDAPERPDPPP